MIRSTVVALFLLGLACSAGAQTTPLQKLSFPEEEYVQRRQALVASLRTTGGGILLAPSRSRSMVGGSHRQPSDFLYFTGLELPDSVLAVDAISGKATVFVPDRGIAQGSGIKDVRLASSLKESLAEWNQGGRTVLFNAREPFPVTPAPFDGVMPTAALRMYVSRLQPDLKTASAHKQVSLLRMVKSPAELAVMKRACAITATSIMLAAGLIRDGINERMLEGELERAFKMRGAQRPAFDSVIKSGPNSLWPWGALASQYDRRNRRMRTGELVVFEVGCELNHYVSDIGRTFPVSGRFTPRQAELVRLVTAVSDAIIGAARPGATLADLERLAVQVIPEKERGFISLEFGDHGLDGEELRPGMTLAVEPRYRSQQEQVAVSIEDVIQITETGCINYTSYLPRSPQALEKLVGYWRQGDGAPRANRLRVMAYNIHHGAGLDEKLDLERIARVIERENPDVVALQEIDVGCERTGSVDQAAKLGELLGMHAVFGPFMDYGGGRYGMALLSRHPLEATWNHRLPAGAEPRTALTARVRMTGTERRFLLSGIHFYRTEAERLAQAKTLLSALEGEQLPVILAGDFNSHPRTAVMKLLERRFITMAKDGGRLTFPANKPDREIDWIMISKGAPLKTVSCSVIEESVASDHRPILAVLDWR